MKRYIRSAVVNLNDESANNLAMIAWDIDTPSEILEQISKCKNADISVKRALAYNPNTPIDILVRYANQVLKQTLQLDVGTCLNLGRNPSLPEKYMEKFAAHKNSYVRVAVAANPNAPMHILEKLASDKELRVIRTVLTNPNISEDMYNSIYSRLSANNIETLFEGVFIKTDNKNEDDIMHVIREVLSVYNVYPNSIDFGVDETVYEEYEEQDDYEVDGFSIWCPLIPDSNDCDAICNELTNRLSEMGYEIVEISHVESGSL